MSALPESQAIRKLLQRPSAVIMGIVNTTPDSFSDGGRFNTVDSAISHAHSLLEEGADILDIGGESTRPGAIQVSLQEELDRVIPVIESLCDDSEAIISIDTYKPEVMLEATKAGASMINDTNALRANGAVEIAAESSVTVCLMHMLGKPKDMQQQPQYEHVVDDVISFLKERVSVCRDAGISKSDIFVDPGIGFGKTLSHNLSLLKATPQLRQTTGCEVLIGASRKSMIDAILKRPVDQRLHASVGIAVQAVLNGAKIVRVHDVRASFDAIRCVEAVLNA